jgi:hypothetical protein
VAILSVFFIPYVGMPAYCIIYIRLSPTSGWALKTWAVTA